MSEVILYDDIWSAALYDFQSAGRHDDVPLWLELAERAGGPVLELACGAARALLPIAEAGYHTVGLDLSPYMLSLARNRAAQASPAVRERVRLVEGDMAGFDLGEEFGVIYITARSFQALLTRERQRACLESCRRHLRAGGLLGLDVFNPKLSRLIAPGGVDEEPAEYPGPDGCTIRETGHTDYHLADQSLVWTSRHECRAANGETTIHDYSVALHYFFRFEAEWMLEACGFQVQALYGGFDRCPYTAESGEMIFVARRA